MCDLFVVDVCVVDWVFLVGLVGFGELDLVVDLLGDVYACDVYG